MGLNSLSLFAVAAIFRAGLSANPQQWQASDCQDVASPQGYDFQNANQQTIAPEFYQTLTNACVSNGGNGFANPNACDREMKNAEASVESLLWTSDRDLAKIYNMLFGCNSNSNSVAKQLTTDQSSLRTLNETVFGSTSSPGLVKDLLTLLDGIQQVKAVATGQFQQLRLATNNQKQAAETVQQRLVEMANRIETSTESLMTQLVANRTIAQEYVFNLIYGSVHEAIDDIEEQSNAVSEGLVGTYGDLQNRFAEWTDLSDKSIMAVTERTKDSRSLSNQLSKDAQQAVRDMKGAQLVSVTSAFDSAKSQFASDLLRTQGDISKDLTGLGTQLANDIGSAASQFGSSVALLQRDLTMQVNSLTNTVNSGQAQLTVNDRDTRQRASAAMDNLNALMRTSVNPIVQDIQSTVAKVTALQAAVEAARAHTDADIVAVRDPALRDAIKVGSTIASNFQASRRDFDSKFDTIRKTMVTAIQTKVSTGRGKLVQILQSVQSSQTDAADQQARQGTTAQDEANASKTAAELAAAKEQAAASSTKASLDTMINVVGSALQDAQVTLQDVSRANVEQILKVKGTLSEADKATLTKAYEEIQKANSDASRRTSGTREDSYAAQLDGQELEQSIEQAGVRLDGTVAYQNQQAQHLLGEINDIMNVAKQNGGTLQDQMTSFERQAPAMFAILQQKIAAYKALQVAQGKQAQTSAANAVGAGATSALSQLANSLQGMNIPGASVGLASSESATASDTAALLQDVQLVNAQIAQQAASGASVVSSTAQTALVQSMSDIKSASADSQDALTALISFDADLVAKKRTDVLTSGDSAMNAAIMASEYLRTNALKFVGLSRQFVVDATGLGAKAGANLTRMTSDINSTLVDTTASAEVYLTRLAGAASLISSWPGQVVARASEINAEIQSKMTEITAAIAGVQGLSQDTTAEIRKSSLQLQTYIDDLVKAFDKQRGFFNDFSRQYAMRRIEVLTGLNQTLLAQKVDFLSGLASADLSEAERTSQTNSILQGLVLAVENAKTQGGADMDRVTSLVSSIGDGVGGLTRSLTNQMQTDVSKLKQQAMLDAVAGGKSLDATVGQAGHSANLLGDQFARAMDQISKSELAGELAASGASKDVYAIAGLLRSVGQETQRRIATLLKAVQSGDISFQEAVDAAKDMTTKQVTTVKDIIDVFDDYLTQHVEMTRAFNSKGEIATNALRTRANDQLLQHEQTEAGMLADLEAAKSRMDGFKAALLGGTGQINVLKTARDAAINAAEDQMSLVLFGPHAGPGILLQRQRRLAPIALVQADPGAVVDTGTIQALPVAVESTAAAVTAASPAVTVSIPEAILDLKQQVASASLRVSSAKVNLDESVTSSLSKANVIVNHILDLTRQALGIAAVSSPQGSTATAVGSTAGTSTAVVAAAGP